MHELSIAMNIVEIAEESARKEGALAVSEIELEIGELSGVVLDALKFAMDSAVKGTMLENAKVKMIIVKGLAKCTECATTFETDTAFEPCPECGNPFSDVIRGKEMTVKKLKVE